MKDDDLKLWLKALGICLLCYVPPAFMIDYFGMHWYTGALLFWGGMIFQHFLRKLIEAQ